MFDADDAPLLPSVTVVRRDLRNEQAGW